MASELNGPSTWGAELARAEGVLAAAGVSAPQHEAAVLLSYVLGVSAPELLARPASRMRQGDVRTYHAWVTRRAAGDALSHITGHLEFMGLDIAVGPGGPLISPGAQRLVETALQWARRRAPGALSVAEIGTGCGAIALALAALEPRFTRIYAVESSASALETARTNGARYLLNLVINWLDGEGPDTVPEPVDLIVCSRPVWAGLERVPEKLRPGGALICAVATDDKDAVVGLLTSYFSNFTLALSWMEDLGDGYTIAVASRRHRADEEW